METLLKKLENLSNAFNELNAEWNKDIDKGSAILNTLYPFKSSFDDLNIEVKEWLQDVKNKVDYFSDELDLTKKDLVYFKDEGVYEPFLVLREDDDMLVLGLRDYPQTEMDFYIEKDVVSYYVDDAEFEVAKKLILSKI